MPTPKPPYPTAFRQQMVELRRHALAAWVNRQMLSTFV
jgi:hypothetical protein